MYRADKCKCKRRHKAGRIPENCRDLAATGHTRLPADATEGKGKPVFRFVLACLLILAHAAIPHHRHNRTFTAIADILGEDMRAAFSHTHDPVAHHSLDDIALTFKSVLSAQQHGKARTVTGDETTRPVPAGPILLSYATSGPSICLNRQLPPTYIAVGCRDFIVCGKGLRAPPAC